MTTPRDRVSFGTHAFPFFGAVKDGKAQPSLPMLPIRLRPPGGGWSHIFNAVLDTGSTRSVIPRAMAEAIGLSPSDVAEPMQGSGADFETTPAPCDLAIVDAHFPEVTCWELHGLTVHVPVDPKVLRYPVVGWDVLLEFEIKLIRRLERLEMRMIIHSAGTL